MQLKKDLDSSTVKIFDLNHTLESYKSQLKETEFNLKLTTQKSTTFEEKLNELNENCIKMKLKEELKCAELSVLNDKVQQLSREKQLACREVEELKDQLTYYQAFQKELEARQAKIKVDLARTKE